MVGKFGPDYAKTLRQNRRRVGRRWHVDEVFIRIRGTIQHLSRAVDQNGQVVDAWSRSGVIARLRNVSFGIC